MKRRRLTMVAMAVGGVLAVASPAVAATPTTFGALVPSTFVEAYGSAPVPESDVGSVTTACPAGTAVVSTGGGGVLDGLTGITPAPGFTSGVASARAGRGDRAAQVTGMVTCAPTAQFAGTTIATSRPQYIHSPTGEWTQTITCPAGMRGFGGGGYFKAADGTISRDNFDLNANSPTLNGRGWTVSGMDNTFTDRLIVTTRCAYQSSSTRLVEETFPIPTEPGTGYASGYAHCPEGYLPISGGAQITQDGSASAAHSRLVWSVSVRNGQTGWFASGSSGGEHPRLHVVALCGS
jgi:hypothetical protein